MCVFVIMIINFNYYLHIVILSFLRPPDEASKGFARFARLDSQDLFSQQIRRCHITKAVVIPHKMVLCIDLARFTTHVCVL